MATTDRLSCKAIRRYYQELHRQRHHRSRNDVLYESYITVLLGGIFALPLLQATVYALRSMYTRIHDLVGNTSSSIIISAIFLSTLYLGQLYGPLRVQRADPLLLTLPIPQWRILASSALRSHAVITVAMVTLALTWVNTSQATTFNPPQLVIAAFIFSQCLFLAWLGGQMGRKLPAIGFLGVTAILVSGLGAKLVKHVSFLILHNGDTLWVVGAAGWIGALACLQFFTIARIRPSVLTAQKAKGGRASVFFNTGAFREGFAALAPATSGLRSMRAIGKGGLTRRLIVGWLRAPSRSIAAALCMAAGAILITTPESIMTVVCGAALCYLGAGGFMGPTRHEIDNRGAGNMYRDPPWTRSLRCMVPTTAVIFLFVGGTTFFMGAPLGFGAALAVILSTFQLYAVARAATETAPMLPPLPTALGDLSAIGVLVENVGTLAAFILEVD